LRRNSFLSLRLPRREPPPSLLSGDFSRRELEDDLGKDSAPGLFAGALELSGEEANSCWPRSDNVSATNESKRLNLNAAAKDSGESEAIHCATVGRT